MTNGRKVMGSLRDVYIKDNEEEADDFAWVSFKIGGAQVEKQLTDLLVHEFRAFKDGAHERLRHHRVVARFFESKMADGTSIIVRTRKDRPPHNVLISMQVGAFQRCSVHADAFPTIGEAGVFLSRVAQSVADGTCPIENAYELRDQLLAEIGIEVVGKKKKGDVFKRPAAISKVGVDLGQEKTEKVVMKKPSATTRGDACAEDEPRRPSKRFRAKTSEPSGGTDAGKKDMDEQATTEKDTDVDGIPALKTNAKRKRRWQLVRLVRAPSSRDVEVEDIAEEAVCEENSTQELDNFEGATSATKELDGTGVEFFDKVREPFVWS